MCYTVTNRGLQCTHCREKNHGCLLDGYKCERCWKKRLHCSFTIPDSWARPRASPPTSDSDWETSADAGHRAEKHKNRRHDQERLDTPHSPLTGSLFGSHNKKPAQRGVGHSAQSKSSHSPSTKRELNDTNDQVHGTSLTGSSSSAAPWFLSVIHRDNANRPPRTENPGSEITTSTPSSR